MQPMFSGTGVALVTPFNNDFTVDVNALKKLVNYVVEGGVNYLVVLGTTGETATLSTDEKKQIVDIVLETNNNRVKVVLGHGGNDTLKLIKEYKTLNLTGISGILSVSPYYNKPNQEGIYQHYKRFAEVCELPIIVYNVPGRTGSNMLPSTTLKLANDFKNIVAIKEASGNIEQCMTIIKNKPQGFELISGDDNLTYPLMALGAIGVISVTAQAIPALFSKMVNNCLQNNFNDALKLHYLQYELTEQLFADGNPGGIKAALNILGISNNVVRPPLYQVNQQVYDKIKTSIKTLV
jgi:4-hydroxy-tetrahydrodipicolinate synthase